MLASKSRAVSCLRAHFGVQSRRGKLLPAGHRFDWDAVLRGVERRLTAASYLLRDSGKLEEAQVGWDDESISLAAIEIAALSREPSLRDRKGAILQIIKYAGHLRSLGEQLRFVRQFAGASLSKTDLFLAASLAIGPLFTGNRRAAFSKSYRRVTFPLLRWHICLMAVRTRELRGGFVNACSDFLMRTRFRDLQID